MPPSRKKIILAVFAGVLSFALAPLGLSTIINHVQIDVAWSLVFPITIALAYNWKYALLAGLTGGGLFPFLLWPEEGYANLLTASLFISFYVFLGISKNHRPASKHLPRCFFVLLVLLLYIPVFVLGYRFLFPPLLSLNPSFWIAETREYLEPGILFRFGLKDSFNLIFLTILGETLLKLPPMRKLMGLRLYSTGKSNVKVFLISLFTALLIWLVLSALYFILLEDRGFLKDGHLFVALLVIVFSGVIVARVLIHNSEKHYSILLELEESEKRYRGLFENASDAILMMKDGYIIDCNLKAEELFWRNRNEILGLMPWDLSPPYQTDGTPSWEKGERIIEQVARGNNLRFEWLLERPGSGPFEVDVTFTPVMFSSEPFVLSIIRDISDKKKLERELGRSLFMGEENERARVARELHDGLGPLLSTCKIYLQSLHTPENEPHQAEAYQKLSEMLKESLACVREISHNLSPNALRSFGLVAALRGFIEKIESGLTFHVESHITKEKRYDETIEATLYRVLAELINNSLKYARANRIDIELIEKGRKLMAHYKDDGIGFDLEKVKQSHRGFGLLNIQSRVENVGGTISIKSGENQGVRVHIAVPI